MPASYSYSCITQQPSLFDQYSARCNSGAMTMLGQRVREAREGAGLTQAQLAERVGMRQQSLGDLERGRNKGSSKITEIAIACRVEPEWLATGNGPKSRSATLQDTGHLSEAFTPSTPSPGAKAAELIPMATPKTQGALEAIVTAARAGTLTEADLLLLESIALRLAQAPPPQGHNAKALKRIRRGPSPDR